MSTLGELLALHRDVIIERMLAASSRGAGPAGGSPIDRVRVSMLLDGLVARLEGKAPLVSVVHVPDDEALAAARALAVLHGLVVETAADHDVAMSLGEHAIVASHVSGAVEALVGKTQQRAQLEHLAHQIRNPLGSALMAASLLRAKVDLGEGARLGDMLERNLKRVETLLSGVVDAEPAEPAPGKSG